MDIFMLEMTARKLIRGIEEINTDRTLYCKTVQRLKDVLKNVDSALDVLQDKINKNGDKLCKRAPRRQYMPPITYLQGDLFVNIRDKTSKYSVDTQHNDENCTQVAETSTKILDNNVGITKNEITSNIEEVSKEYSEISKNIEKKRKRRNRADTVGMGTTRAVLTRAEKVKHLKEIHRMISSMDTVLFKDYKSLDAANCAVMISTWYEYRIRGLNPKTSAFRYNLADIQKYVKTLIVAYSKVRYEVRFSTEDVEYLIDEFVSEFCAWCRSLKGDNASCPYALPWNVYNSGTDLHKEYDLPVQAVAIWDELWDLYFCMLQNNDMECLAWKKDSMFELFEVYGEPGVHELKGSKNRFAHTLKRKGA